MVLKLLFLFFSVAAVKTSLLAHISVLDRGGRLRGGESWQGWIGDFHRAPLHLWVIMVTCENFPSLNPTYRLNVLNLKSRKDRKISRYCSHPLRRDFAFLRCSRFDVQASRQAFGDARAFSFTPRIQAVVFQGGEFSFQN